MAAKKITTFAEIESRFPGFMNRLREIIGDSEKSYEGGSSGSESFLWEHTTHVASIADRLAQLEKIDPLIPVVAALFHDAGKFVGGKYHAAGTIEEMESARIAERLMREYGMKVSEIRRVLSGLKALYNESIRKNHIAAILHDADFLSKFGALGVAAFFTKATLRGRTLRSAVLGHLSKATQKFFHSLLTELRDERIADLEIRRLRIPHPAHKHRLLAIRLVASSNCPECGKDWNMGWTTEKDVKCNKLNLDWSCSHCGKQLETSFCLPEIA
jgi:HD superfamily phosphodiesterase/predicted RNA-binding Zn-ribbon protein involved in translation (DUF1610 family)